MRKTRLKREPVLIINHFPINICYMVEKCNWVTRRFVLVYSEVYFVISCSLMETCIRTKVVTCMEQRSDRCGQDARESASLLLVHFASTILMTRLTASVLSDRIWCFRSLYLWCLEVNDILNITNIVNTRSLLSMQT